MNRGAARQPIRVWALLGRRAGDNDQVLALAESLRLPFEAKSLQYNRLRSLGPRLLGRSLASLTSASRAQVLSERPPDLTISTGHRSVAVVAALRQRARGGMRSIHIGFPRVSPSRFDLVIATPQYPVAEHPNVLRIPYALTTSAVNPSRGGDPAVEELPRPRHLLMVGGPTLFWELDRSRLLKALEAMLDAARDDSGSVIVTTSPRTPAALRSTIATILANAPAATLLAEPHVAPVYAGMLAAADSIRVTADSVSMISDGIWTGKPLAIIPIVHSPLGLAIFGLMHVLRPRAHVYPQDLRFFWKALADIGASETPAIPRTPTDDVMAAVIDRARAVVEPIVSAASEGS